MIASPRTSQLALMVLGLTLALAVVPSAVVAERPHQKGDFTIHTHEQMGVWEGDTYGTWKMSGIESDSGPLTGLHGSPLSHLWLEGELGDLYIVTDGSTPGNLSFEVVDGTRAYTSWVGASGTFRIAYGRERRGTIPVKRTLEGFLPLP